MKLYDLENHMYDLATMEVVSKRKEYPIYDPDAKKWYWSDKMVMEFSYLYGALTDIGDGRIALMDRNDITTAVLSTSMGVEDLEASVAIDLTKKINDSIYAATQKYPGRFLGSAALPVWDVNASVKELERCVNELGFVSWHTHSNYGKLTCEAEQFLPIWEAAADLGIYVYLHPTLPAYAEIAGYADFGYTLSAPGLGFTADTMLTTMKIICSGMLDKVPKTKLMLGHFGEAIPFLLERIDNRIAFLPNPLIKNQRKPSDYFRDNIWTTTSGNMSAAAYRCTRDVLGIEKIIYASDYPYESIDDMTNFAKGLEISEEDREWLFFKAAESLILK